LRLSTFNKVYDDDDDDDRPTSPRASFQELTQVWAIDHSLLLDRCLEQAIPLYMRDSELTLLE